MQEGDTNARNDILPFQPGDCNVLQSLTNQSSFTALHCPCDDSKHRKQENMVHISPVTSC